MRTGPRADERLCLHCVCSVHETLGLIKEEKGEGRRGKRKERRKGERKEEERGKEINKPVLILIHQLPKV